MINVLPSGPEAACVLHPVTCAQLTCGILTQCGVCTVCTQCTATCGVCTNHPPTLVCGVCTALAVTCLASCGPTCACSLGCTFVCTDVRVCTYFCTQNLTRQFNASPDCPAEPAPEASLTALSALKEQLKQQLAEVEKQHAAAEAGLLPQSVEEADMLTNKLQDALEELKAHRAELAKKPKPAGD